MRIGFKRQCWLEWLALGFGLPALISAFSKLVSLSVPAARTGALGQRYIWSLVGPVAAEWVFVIGAVFILKRRGDSLRSLGLERMGNSSREWVYRSTTRLRRRDFTLLRRF